MFFWSQFPALRVFIPLAAGIILGFYDVCSFYTALFFCFFSVGSCILVGRISSSFTPLFLIAWLSMGLSLQLAHSSLKKDSDIQKLSGKNIAFLASLKELPTHKGKTAHAIAKVYAFQQAGKWTRINSSVFLTFTDNPTDLPKPENLFIGVAEFNTIRPAVIPHEFDFATHLKKKDVFLQCKIKPTAYGILTDKRPFWHPEVFAAKAGAFTLHTLKSIGLNKEDLSVGTALIMGNDALLDHDTISKYAATGALHILSVSGLHVGIVYILLNSLLKHLLNKKKKNGIIRLLLLLAGIWAYSIATGLSTSVIRSANMLSIMVIGETLGKKGFSVNTLAASAVIQCILHPASLLEPGFQLSYLAVLGILTIYSPLKMILQHPNPILAHIASVCSVSLSAQLFTFPLSLYYFQQFPNYFLPANLLIIPVSGIVLYSGLAMLLFSGIPLLHEINVIILKYSLMLMNFMVKFFSELPFAITDNIGLSFINMMILYITIASIIFFFLKMNAVFLRLSLLSIALMSGISMLHEYRIQTQCRWEIYHSDKGRIVALINGKTMHLLSTPGLYRSPYLTRKMKRHWNLDGIEKINWVRLDSTDKEPLCIRIFTEINKGENEKVLKSIIGKKKIHEEHADSFVQGNMPLSLVFTDSRTN